MLRAAQAPVGGPFVAVGRAPWAAAAMLGIALMASGCAGGGFSLAKAEVDPTILTGSVGASGAVAKGDDQSDQITIRNAVSAVDVESLGGGSVPWANPQTGARGAISNLVEEKEGRSLCRRFTTSRERFDGVGVYKGEVCMVAPGAWAVQAFQPL